MYWVDVLGHRGRSKEGGGCILGGRGGGGGGGGGVICQGRVRRRE